MNENKIKSLDDFDDYDEGILANTTIRHLVTHSHGLHELENGTLFREFEAGKVWAYRTINILMMTELFSYNYLYNIPDNEKTMNS